MKELTKVQLFYLNSRDVKVVQKAPHEIESKCSFGEAFTFLGDFYPETSFKEQLQTLYFKHFFSCFQMKFHQNFWVLRQADVCPLDLAMKSKNKIERVTEMGKKKKIALVFLMAWGRHGLV